MRVTASVFSFIAHSSSTSGELHVVLESAMLHIDYTLRWLAYASSKFLLSIVVTDGIH